MDLLKDNVLFDFNYGGKPFGGLDHKKERTETEDGYVTVYELPDGLKITNTARRVGGAFEWVNAFENASDSPSEIISELYDACVRLPMPHEDPLPPSAFQPEFNEQTAVFAPTGSTWTWNEFWCDADVKTNNGYAGHLPPEKSRRYATSGGRSSQKNAPFFNVHKDGRGYILAVGWTGQWRFEISREPDAVLIRSGVEDTHFRLLPGEKIRTSSIVVMPYEGTVIESQNKWRRLVKEHFSLIGSKGRDAQGPLCASVWGGAPSDAVLESVEMIKKLGLPYEYVWMDAGWYGDTQPSLNEFVGDWARHTGDWRVSPHTHPDGLIEVSRAIHAAGMKFLLWVEPERINKEMPIAKEHPEYFLHQQPEGSTSLILDLGREDAWQYCFDTLSGLIGRIGVDCYRQDFNRDPLPYWREHDAEDRRGITEIKHINGLYRLWDALLEKFPHLLIDNCASGGRRIDIETLRRSIPLWRSDYQCPANHLPEGTQCHNLTFNAWMPFSGTACRRDCDTYDMRSGYAPAFNNGYFYNGAEQSTLNDPENAAWLKKMLKEYLKVRPYLSEDFYPLTSVSDRADALCASQFDRPEQGDGVLLIFRRDESPCETAAFTLYGIDESASYEFTDADGGTFTVSGKTLAGDGFRITLPEKRTAKVIFYKKNNS